MADEPRYVQNTDGCDVYFNENKEELIPVNLMLSAREMEELIHGLSYLINSTPPNASDTIFKKVIDSIFSQLR